MADIQHKIDGSTLTLFPEGNIDSTNAADVEAAIQAVVDQGGFEDIVLDFSKLNYISSAGLRVVLRLLKSGALKRIVEVSTDVYEVLEMTGFTEMVEVQKAYRVISVEGCEAIGQGANGKVYRIDPDTIVKVYLNPDALPEIHRERELARAAFVLGIPTAIPYDVVRVGEGYGSVFELLNATSFAKLLQTGEKSVDEIAELSIELLKQIHSTVVKPDTMPSMRNVAVGWARDLEEHLPVEQASRLRELMEAVPEDDHMLHGDYHLKNIMMQNGECLLIDMDTLCHGHPVFELAAMYSAYQGFAEPDHSIIEDFMGIDYDTATQLWKRSLELYFDGASADELQAIEDKAHLVSSARILRRTMRREDIAKPEVAAKVDLYRGNVVRLLETVDSLLF